MRRAIKALLPVLVTLVVNPVDSAQWLRDGRGEPLRIITVTGLKETLDLKTVVQVHVVLTATGAVDVATAEALLAFDLRKASPGELENLGFSLSGPLWSQFLNHRRNDDTVVQYYNADNAPAALAVVPAIVNAQATWSDVPSSRFRLQFGGLTARRPARGDGFHDIGWLRPRPIPPIPPFPPPPRATLGFLAATSTTFSIITGHFVDADVEFDPKFPWTNDGSAFDFEEVMLHEAGHVAGLDHVLDETSVMFPGTRAEDVVRTLSAGDIDGITLLYPRNPSKPVTPRDPTHRYRVVAEQGTSIPTRMALWTTFEPGSLNARGDVAFATDLSNRCTPSDCIFAQGQGVFVARQGQISQVARTPQLAPGGPDGSYFEFGTVGRVALTDNGDAAFAFGLQFFNRFPPFDRAGIYRHDASAKAVTPVIVPLVTPATGCVLEPDIPCVFLGGLEPDINARGDVVFTGVIPSELGASGVFVAQRAGTILNIVVPGDPAPGNAGHFDYASSPSMNAAGDIAFDAHRVGEECIGLIVDGFSFCESSVYVRRAATTAIEPVAVQGDPAPGGGAFRFAVNPVINARGDILFLADLTPAPARYREFGLFLRSGAETIAIVRPGDVMPGGGHFYSANTARFFLWPLYWLNERGAVAFDASLDTDDDGDGTRDTGVYVWDKGSVRLVARTGTTVPDVGVIAHIQHRGFVGAARSFGGALINDSGHVLFQAVLTDGRGVLLVAEPCDSAIACISQ